MTEDTENEVSADLETVIDTTTPANAPGAQEADDGGDRVNRLRLQQIGAPQPERVEQAWIGKCNIAGFDTVLAEPPHRFAAKIG